MIWSRDIAFEFDYEPVERGTSLMVAERASGLTMRVDDTCRVAAVLRAVGGVDLVVEVGVSFHKGDVFARRRQPGCGLRGAPECHGTRRRCAR